jgi:hypothetical protein
MTKLAALLIVAQAMVVQGLPTLESSHKPIVFNERAITLSSSLPVTTSYTSTPSTLQSASRTVSASNTGVSTVLDPIKHVQTY